jgi:hypothetical protein
MKLTLIALLGAACALAAYAQAQPSAPPAPAAAPAPAGSGCFRTRDITNHTVADDHTLYIGVNSREVYRLGMSGACLAGATSSDPLVMREPPGQAYACRPIDLDISITLGGLPHGIPTPCIVKSMTRLTPAEVAALPPRLRP